MRFSCKESFADCLCGSRYKKFGSYIFTAINKEKGCEDLEPRSPFRIAVQMYDLWQKITFPPLGCQNKVKTADFTPKSAVFGPSAGTRTRGILVPKTSRKLCIFYSLFLASYFIKPLISSNFRSHRFFYFRSISGQISGHKSALPSKRNRPSA